MQRFQAKKVALPLGDWKLLQISPSPPGAVHENQKSLASLRRTSCINDILQSIKCRVLIDVCIEERELGIVCVTLINHSICLYTLQIYRVNVTRL